MKKREPSYTVCGNVNWYSHHGEQCRFRKELKLELAYAPAISFPNKYLEKTLTEKDMCSLMYIAALITIAKTWKEPKHPITDERIQKTDRAVGLCLLCVKCPG